MSTYKVETPRGRYKIKTRKVKSTDPDSGKKLTLFVAEEKKTGIVSGSHSEDTAVGNIVALLTGGKPT